jgi:hypothetical protein
MREININILRSETDHILQIEWENSAKSIYSGLLNAVIRNFAPDSHFPLVMKPEGISYLSNSE